ncbi:UDP-N-acetylmuramoyl-tripeptide--D-alanyl-D-alanine ligase [Lentilactobacillus laojiaonis]|uniref:UDP-N-acetylmuramoyl-tripeptide--D-alanyl-D- alanine ligase n=1 Tax=Lentilactobacillus laojiaonis TaxID=2883998 RepID=UPI001D0A7036|nr:UDP-N-acetylmuramoyl-tripeptide--D-alanyl-D-alanine ligase [Lentilactobacillus laojiaonis]UDM31926.1 UDP-N-acetylmuramoyl-tripeptide--D-alanyl-D-alanine ligase [Lentilactobacillus laojiaonis]
MKMTIGEIAKAVNASTTDLSTEVLNTEITNVSFDTRQLLPGALFVPLSGENDGHDYIQNAIENGATATFWDKRRKNDLPLEIPALLVNNPLEALQELSKYYLKKINPKVVAITGSNGKTTTKDMVAAILSNEFNVTKTKDNFNNEIGVPFTVLQMEPNTECLVVELGMDRPGQLDFLSKLVEPDFTIITMIGEAHIEFFGTRDKIADAKMEITNGLKDDGYFIYNGDEPLLVERAKDLDNFEKTFGLGTQNDIYPIDIVSQGSKTTFKTNLWDEEFTIPLMGDYNVSNALAAILVGSLFRLHPHLIAGALKKFDLTKNRTEWLVGNHNEKILSDVYNSNPTAVKEVLQTFKKVPTNNHRIAVLGDMLELGAHSKEMHEQLADYLNPEEFDEIYLIGNDMKNLNAILINKFSPDKVHYYEDGELDQLSHDLQANLTGDDIVLLKASHGIHLEKVINNLTE